MTKVDIISGFLGAGKTTFIRKMIEEVFKGEKVVLIENEFGEVGIDGGFLKDAGIQITEMNQGCICCSLVGDFDKNLREVIEKFSPDRIIIEPSGVGKLSDVMTSIINLEESHSIKLNGLVTRLEKRAESKSATVQKYAFWGLFILVAIPLPGTGAWTGALVAAMLEMPLKKAFPAIMLGVLGAGAIVAFVTYGAGELLFS